METYVLSVLVRNNSGVLSRVAGLFSRRGFNIHSLTVGVTNDPTISRMTIAVNADATILEQIKKQLNKLVDVIKIKELKPEYSVFREIALVKISACKEKRAAVIEIVDIFRGSIIDVSKESLTVEITGEVTKINAFIDLIGEYGIKELARTGLTALGRGPEALRQYNG